MIYYYQVSVIFFCYFVVLSHVSCHVYGKGMGGVFGSRTKENFCGFTENSK
jgi:hypothetical protein